MSDDDLANREELLLGRGALVAPALRHRRRADAAGERHDADRAPEGGGEAAEREVRVAAADRVDDARAERLQREPLVAAAHHRAVLAVGHREAPRPSSANIRSTMSASARWRS